MKTISIRLEDSVYEQLESLLNGTGQTKQTFYETYTLTAIRENCIPFIIRSSPRPKSETKSDKTAAFLELEALRKKYSGTSDPEKEREEAMNEKFGVID